MAAINHHHASAEAFCDTSCTLGKIFQVDGAGFTDTIVSFLDGWGITGVNPTTTIREAKLMIMSASKALAADVGIKPEQWNRLVERISPPLS